MDLRPGHPLGHYRLVEKIGEGGMGVVWRATDTSLGRDVAVKLLPEALAADAERMQRFEREARVLASLNHPNIATIHGLHETDTGSTRPARFLVMELVEGEDLSTRIARGRVPLEEAVEIATQIARALEAAHAQGIVHRDLKPANVRLTSGGNAKVLDFGLAKAFAHEGASGDSKGSADLSPTITLAGTVAGVVLGTASYMSPEQARGNRVDQRADLWAFGCLLFEMITGRRCFDGDTVTDTLASILKEQPDWSLLPPGTPPAIRRLLRRCLAKDPRQRLSDAAAARLELGEALQGPFPGESAGESPWEPSRESHGAFPGGTRGERAGSDTAARSAAARSPSEARSSAVPRAPAGRLPWIVAGIASIVAAAAAFGALGGWLPGGRPAPREPMELSVAIPPGITLNDDQESLLEVSPDGRYLAFSAFEGDSPSSWIYLRGLGDAAITKLPDSSNGINPFFSPDSRWVAFFAEGRLMKIQIGGRSAVPVCDVPGSPRGATWSGNDVIAFAGHFEGGLSQVPAGGGKAAPLTQLDEAGKERTHRWPSAVPGHDVVLYTVATTDSPEFYDDARIDAVRLSSGERRTVFTGARLARYAPTGHLIVAREGFLYAVPFDPVRLEVTGRETLAREGVMGAPTSGAVYASIAQSGLLAYVPGKTVNIRRRLKWFHADGRIEVPSWAPPGGYATPAISPDGKSVAVAVSGERGFDIWAFELESGSRARLTFEGTNTNPVWTRDGKSVIFYSVRDGKGATYITRADGSGAERRVHAAERTSVQPSDVSPDGEHVILAVFGDQKTDLYVKPLADPEAPAVPFVAGPAGDSHARFSPDGRFVAYTSDEVGDFHVFLRPFPGPGGKWQISTQGGIDPQWTRDGRQIHYRVNRGWWVADFDPGDGGGRPVRIGNARQVRNDLPRAELGTTYGMTADGKALLVVTPDEQEGAPLGVTVVTDWFAALERIVGQK